MRRVGDSSMDASLDALSLRIRGVGAEEHMGEISELLHDLTALSLQRFGESRLWSKEYLCGRVCWGLCPQSYFAVVTSSLWDPHSISYHMLCFVVSPALSFSTSFYECLSFVFPFLFLPAHLASCLIMWRKIGIHGKLYSFYLLIIVHSLGNEKVDPLNKKKYLGKVNGIKKK